MTKKKATRTMSDSRFALNLMNILQTGKCRALRILGAAVLDVRVPLRGVDRPPRA
jgi:hypothetical protein